MNINKLKMNKKGQIGGLGSGPIGILLTGGIGIVVLGLILTYSAKISQDVSDDITPGTTAASVSANTTLALGTIGENLSTVSLVLVGVAIITLLIGGFGFVLRR